MSKRIFPAECDLIIEHLRKHVKRPMKPYRTGFMEEYGWRRKKFSNRVCCPQGLLPEANERFFILEEAGTSNLSHSALIFWPIWDRLCNEQQTSEAMWREIWPGEETASLQTTKRVKEKIGWMKTI